MISQIIYSVVEPPIWEKKHVRQIGSSPQVSGPQETNLWNHHLVYVWIVKDIWGPTKNRMDSWFTHLLLRILQKKQVMMISKIIESCMPQYNPEN